MSLKVLWYALGNVCFIFEQILPYCFCELQTISGSQEVVCFYLQVIM
jgi:hypothetical protein